MPDKQDKWTQKFAEAAIKHLATTGPTGGFPPCVESPFPQLPKSVLDKLKKEA